MTCARHAAQRERGGGTRGPFPERVVGAAGAWLRAARWSPPARFPVVGTRRRWTWAGPDSCPGQIFVTRACVFELPWGGGGAVRPACGQVLLSAHLGPTFLKPGGAGGGCLLKVTVFQAPHPGGPGWDPCFPAPGRKGKPWSRPTLSNLTGAKSETRGSSGQPWS